MEIDDRTLDIDVWAPERGDWVAANQLSKGTIDQVYLAARIGLVRLVTQGKRPPLILDDPFVTFDDQRAARAALLLRELSSDFQVIYLACSNRYDGLADAVVELPGPTDTDASASARAGAAAGAAAGAVAGAPPATATTDAPATAPTPDSPEAPAPPDAAPEDEAVAGPREPGRRDAARTGGGRSDHGRTGGRSDHGRTGSRSGHGRTGSRSGGRSGAGRRRRGCGCRAGPRGGRR